MVRAMLSAGYGVAGLRPARATAPAPTAELRPTTGEARYMALWYVRSDLSAFGLQCVGLPPKPHRKERAN